jgi:hypothetical protein
MIKRTALIFLVSLFCFSAAHAQTATPEAAARGFYRWYLRELNRERNPIDQSRPEMRKRVSARLARYLFSPKTEFGADYFLDLQDRDESWVNTVTVSPAKVTGGTATVTVTLPKTDFFERKVLAVTLIREAGAWKIDKVRGR